MKTHKITRALIDELFDIPRTRPAYGPLDPKKSSKAKRRPVSNKETTRRTTEGCNHERAQAIRLPRRRPSLWSDQHDRTRQHLSSAAACKCGNPAGLKKADPMCSNPLPPQKGTPRNE